MADVLSINDIRYFNVYDNQTKQLKYSKKNFNFDLYKKDFNLNNKTKLEIFDHFLVANNTAYFNEPSFPNKGTSTPSYLKPTTLKEELKKYFTPMTQQIINFNNLYGFTVHPGYMNIQDPSTYVSITRLVKEQFDLVYYKPDQLRKLQDYFYSDNQGYYTKYNFNFDKFSQDFNVYGNKLVVFTDFISRVIYSSGSFIGAYGYGVPYGFRKYFIQSKNLVDYMNKHGTTSIYKNVAFKNEYSIDYKDYAKQANLGNVSLEVAKENYMRNGQFTQTKINFVIEKSSSKQVNISSICKVYTKKGSASGFLYKNNTDNNIYVVTVNHILDKENLSNFMASFSIYNNTRDNITTKALFKVIGRDLLTDICVGVYDPELPYNKTFKPDLSPYKKLTIDLTSKYKIGDNVYTCGNIERLDNNTVIKGSIMDPNYGGSFIMTPNGSPECLLLNIDTCGGMSGSPIFKENNDKEIIGMLIGSVKNNYKAALGGFIFQNLVTLLIEKYKSLIPIYRDDEIALQLRTGRSINRKWFGAKCSYFHPQLSPKKIHALQSFEYTGGLVLENFYLGFNNTTKKYIYNTKSLQEDNITKLEGPLLNSKLYQRFIDTGKTPIVLKSVTFTQGLKGQYAKYEFGLFGNQDGYYNYGYGLSSLGTKEVPKDKGVNKTVDLYGNIILEYFYFDGVSWILEEETINSNDEMNYTTYDYLGNKYYDSKWNFPVILYNYEESFVKSIDPINSETEMGDRGGGYDGCAEQARFQGNDIETVNYRRLCYQTSGSGTACPADNFYCRYLRGKNPENTSKRGLSVLLSNAYDSMSNSNKQSWKNKSKEYGWEGYYAVNSDGSPKDPSTSRYKKSK